MDISTSNFVQKRRSNKDMSKLSSSFKLYGLFTLAISLCLCSYTYFKYRELDDSNYSNLRVEFSKFKETPEGLQFSVSGKTLILYKEYYGNTDVSNLLESKHGRNIEFMVKDVGANKGEIKSLIVDGENIVSHANVLLIDRREVDLFVFVSSLSLICCLLWLLLYKFLIWIENRKTRS